MTHKPTLAVITLAAAVLELAALNALHLSGWLLLNMALGALLFVGALLWKVRHNRATGGRTRGALGGLGWSRATGAGRLPGLLGRGRTTSGGLPAGGRPGLMGRLAGRSRPGGAALGGASTGGGRAGLLGRLAGRPTGARSTGGTQPGGGSRPGLLGRLGGRGRSATSTSGRPGGTASRPGLLGRLTGRGRSPGTGTSAVGLAGRSTGTPGRSGVAGSTSPRRTGWFGRQVADFRKASRLPVTKTATPKKTTAAAGPALAPTSPQQKPAVTRPAAKPSAAPQAPETARPAATPPLAPTTRPTQPVPPPAAARHGRQRRTPAMTSHAEENAIADIKHSDDSSLQAWGRGLKTIAPALNAVHEQHKAAHATTAAAAETMTKVANQAQSDLPVSKSLAAEADSIAAGLRALAADEAALEERRKALISRAESLPGIYAREHETDEDRLRAPRNSRGAEKRADVGAAEQDT